MRGHMHDWGGTQKGNWGEKMKARYMMNGFLLLGRRNMESAPVVGSLWAGSFPAIAVVVEPKLGRSN